MVIICLILNDDGDGSDQSPISDYHYHFTFTRFLWSHFFYLIFC